MAWDILHLRMISIDSSYYVDERVDALIPYFYTYDRRLNDIKLCYSVRALVINNKNNDVLPFYYMDTDTVVDIKSCSTFGEHLERSHIKLDVDALIAECEREIISVG